MTQKGKPQSLLLTYKIRRAHVQRLLQRFDTITAFAETIGRQPDYVSRMLSDKEGKKTIGEEIARSIEEAFKLPRGYLDFESSEGVAEPVPEYNVHWKFAIPISLLREIDRLTPPQQQDIEGLIEDRVARFKATQGPRRRKKSRVAERT